uniref:Uncharacterized protein n=1 Tax=Anguilla anguilla TaxID=7936 RepID=A0A0E9QMS4_ANGAN
MFCYSLAHTDTLGSGPYLVNVYLFIYLLEIDIIVGFIK